MFKVNNKDTRIRKVNDKVKNKDTVDVVLASLLLDFEHISLLASVFADHLIAGWGCLLSWHFVPARINLGKVSTYGETRSINCTSKMHENT